MFREMGEEKSGKKYGVLKNSFFMLQEARKNVPSVIWLAVLDGLIAVAVSVIELYVAPSILKNLEMHGMLSGLLSTILFFTAGITAADRIAGSYRDPGPVQDEHEFLPAAGEAGVYQPAGQGK